MLKTFGISYRLRSTYNVNSFIYTLKMIPLVGKLIPDNFYADPAIKVVGIIVSIFVELFQTFGYKLLYVVFALFLPMSMFESVGKSQAFVHIFFFMTLAGAFANRPMFEVSKDKIYALSLIKMNARDYSIVNFGYYCLRALLGMELSILIFGLLFGVPMLPLLLAGPFVVLVKVVYAAWELRYKAKRDQWESKGFKQMGFILGGAFVVAAYGLPLIGFAIPLWAYYTLAGICAAAVIPAFLYLFRSESYLRLYKSQQAAAGMILDPKKTAAAMQAERMKKKIDLDPADDKELSGRFKGYGYFHRLFMRRHRRLMSRMANIIALVAVAAFAGLCIICVLVPDARAGLNNIPLTYLPYFLILMYAINRGQTVTQAMFMNCDQSMLSYRFYRQPRDILGLFTLRLRSVVGINLVPAFVVALGMCMLLLLSGGTANPLNYGVLFISIISMSVFYSVHHLVLYYLLQPYNAQVEMKSKMYNIISGVTYMVSYLFINVELPTLQFGTCVILFTVLYLVLSLFIAYRQAPKTFKLRS